jgi:hypothetical protein
VAGDYGVVDRSDGRAHRGAPYEHDPDNFRGGSDSVAAGVLVGLIGYVLTVCAFAYAAFYHGGQNPHDTLATALGVLVTGASAVTMAVVIAAIIGVRRRPGRSAGLLVGAIAGLLLALVFFLPTSGEIGNLDKHCPCAPLVQQLPTPSP